MAAVTIYSDFGAQENKVCHGFHCFPIAVKRREAKSKGEKLLILWLQSPSAVVLETKKTKSITVSTVSPSICHEVTGPDAMILVF